MNEKAQSIKITMKGLKLSENIWKFFFTVQRYILLKISTLHNDYLQN